jgi:hypothetical protein
MAMRRPAFSRVILHHIAGFVPAERLPGRKPCAPIPIIRFGGTDAGRNPPAEIVDKLNRENRRGTR